jgi:hypothetical protein
MAYDGTQRGMAVTVGRVRKASILNAELLVKM